MTRLLCLVILLLPTLASAGDFSGYVEGKGFVYTESYSRSSQALGWGTLFTKWEDKLGPAQFTASLRAEWLSEDQGPLAFDPADRRLKRVPFSVRDLWLRLPLGPALDLQLGRFQLGWGKTDGYSPADAFLPRDLTDPFADEKLPLWALRLSGQEGVLRFDTVLCPVTTPWRLPVLGGRNAPLSAEGLPAGTRLTDLDGAPPVPGFLALRTLVTLGDWDLGAWARAGVRPAPLLRFRGDLAGFGSDGFVLPVQRRYAHEEGVGVELSRVLGGLILRGEVAGLFSRDPELGNAVIGSLSAERGFGDGTLLVTLAANALRTRVDESLLFDRALLPVLIAAWNRTEEWGEWKAVWSTGLRFGDGLVKLEAGYNLTDLWKLGAGAEFPYGNQKGPVGALHPAQRVLLSLRRSW